MRHLRLRYRWLRPLMAVLAVAFAIGSATGCGGGSASPSAGPPTVSLLSLLPRTAPADRQDVQAIEAGIEASIRAHGGRAGAYVVNLVVGNSSDPSLGSEYWQSCPSIGARYARDPQIVGVVGPLTDTCAAGIVPAFARRDVAVVSPTADAPVFTHVAPLVRGGGFCQVTQQNAFSLSGCRPADFYSRGVRTYAHVATSVDQQGSVAAGTLARLGVKRVYVLAADGEDDWMLVPFQKEAQRLGIKVVGVAGPNVYKPTKKAIRKQARAVLASKADGLFLVGEEADPTGRDHGLAPYLQELHRRGFRGRIVGSFWLPNGLLTQFAPQATEGMFYTSTRLPLAALPQQASALAARLKLHGRYAVDAVYGAAATEVLLDAIAASDGTRAGVRAALFRVRENGLLGELAIDTNGDPQPARVSVFRVRRGALVYLRTLDVEVGAVG